MAASALPAANTFKNLYAGAVSAGELTVTMTAGNTDGNYFSGSDKQILLVHNTHASNAYTFTLTSVADPYVGRTRDVTAYSLAAGEIAAVYIPGTGYKNTSNGRITVTPENAAIKFGVLQFFN